jgi:hypothetical protein
MDLMERLARHEQKIQARITAGEGFRLPEGDELRDEAEFLADADGPDLDVAITAEERYVEVLRQLVAARREADHLWSKLGADPGDLEHRRGGLGAFEDLLPQLDGAASDEYLLQAAPESADAAIIYAYKFLIYGLAKLDEESFDWWDQKSPEERLAEVLDLFEQFALAEPIECRRALTRDGTIAPRVVRAMRADDPVEALREDLL